MTTLTVKSVWAFLEGREEPQLVLAWDIQAVERDPDGFREECKKVLARDDLKSFRVIDIDVDVRAPKLAGRTLYLRARRALVPGKFVLMLESAADEDLDHTIKLNRKAEEDV